MEKNYRNQNIFLSRISSILSSLSLCFLSFSPSFFHIQTMNQVHDIIPFIGATKRKVHHHIIYHEKFASKEKNLIYQNSKTIHLLQVSDKLEAHLLSRFLYIFFSWGTQKCCFNTQMRHPLGYEFNLHP